MSAPRPKTVSAAEFKAHCLALLDEVARTHVPVVVTKRGKPVAKLTPLDPGGPASLLGSVRYSSEEDLLSPVDDTWDADR